MPQVIKLSHLSIFLLIQLFLFRYLARMFGMRMVLAVRFEYDGSQMTYEGFDVGSVLPNAQAPTRNMAQHLSRSV